MNVLGVLQARMSSRRLPGKVLRLLRGEPMLARQVERVKRAERIDHLIVATSTQSDDDPIAALAQDLGMQCYRGPLDDVAARCFQAAKTYEPAHILKLAGDSPLVDPVVLDGLVRFHIDGGFDYSTNGLKPSWPDGLDGEVFTIDCLEDVYRNASLPSEREHLVPYFLRHPERVRIGHYQQEGDLSHLRWTVDHPEDFTLVERIYEALYPTKPAFTTDDILALLNETPDLIKLNAGKERNAGRTMAMAADGLG